MDDGSDDHECYDFVSDCRVRAATDLLSHSWDPVVLSGLRRGPVRRKDLIATIGGISDKAVTESLARLTGSGLVDRDASSPRHAVYRLTPLGRTFVDGPLAALGRWAVDHAGQLTISS